MSKFIRSFKVVFALLCLSLTMASFENCSGVGAKFSFSSPSTRTLTDSLESHDNGEGYLGKPLDGDFERRLPDYQCGNQLPQNLQGLIHVAQSKPNLLLDNCVDLSYDLTLTDPRVRFLPYNLDFIGLNSGIFERIDPVNPSSRVSEAWCRWNPPNGGIDAVIRLDPQSTTPAQAQVYMGKTTDQVLWSSRVNSPFNVDRNLSANELNYTTGSFHLKVLLTANALGDYSGNLNMLMDGVYYDVPVSCKMMSAPAALTPLSPNLVGLWQMNGLLGPALGTVADLSVYGNSGVLADSNSTLTYQAGPYRESLRSVDDDDFIRVNPSPSLNNLSAFSVAAWIRMDQSDAVLTENFGGGIAWKAQFPATAVDPQSLYITSGWSLAVPSQTSRIQFRAAFSGGFLEVTTDPLIKPIMHSQWHHVAVTWNGSASAASAVVYIDGLLAPLDSPMVNGIGTRVPDAGNSLILGYYPDSMWRTFRGNLDQVQVWNRVLTPAEISNLHQSGSVVP